MESETKRELLSTINEKLVFNFQTKITIEENTMLLNNMNNIENVNKEKNLRNLKKVFHMLVDHVVREEMIHRQ
jgi:hypothetical protein